MAIALTTTSPSASGAEFSPAAETVFQAAQEAGVDAIIDIEGRVDDEAAWSPLASWRIASGAFFRVAYVPRLRVQVRGNRAGATLTVRRSA